MTRKMPEADDDERYTIDETAAKLKICRDTLDKYTKLGLIKPTYHLTYKRYYYGREIKRFWADRH